MIGRKRPRRRDPRGYIVFLASAVVLLVLLDWLLSGISPFVRPPSPQIRQQEKVEAAAPASAPVLFSAPLGRTEIDDYRTARAIMPAFTQPNLAPELPRAPPEPPEASFPGIAAPSPVPEPQPQWERNAVPAPSPTAGAKIAVIIDDMGMDRRHTKAAIDLPGPITMAFLPYAPEVAAQADQARAAGHELMVHMPMEPLDGALDAGPQVIRAGMDPAAFDAVMAFDLDAFPGYVGVNNHMGSRATQDREAMARLMGNLKRRGLLFVDSRTIGGSVAADEAAKAGIPWAVRDVFLDDAPDLASVRESLQKVEAVARKTGLAIAIGHPKAETLEALREWIPTLAGKGMTLVPVSAAVRKPQKPDPAMSSGPMAAAPPSGSHPRPRAE